MDRKKNHPVQIAVLASLAFLCSYCCLNRCTTHGIIPISIKNVGKNVLNQVYRVSTYDACPVALNGFKAFNLKPKKIKKNSNATLNAQIQHPNK